MLEYLIHPVPMPWIVAVVYWLVLGTNIALTILNTQSLRKNRKTLRELNGHIDMTKDMKNLLESGVPAEDIPGLRTLNVQLKIVHDFKSDDEQMAGCFSDRLRGKIDLSKFCRKFLTDAKEMMAGRNGFRPVMAMVIGDDLHMLVPEVVDAPTEAAAVSMAAHYAKEHGASLAIAVAIGLTITCPEDEELVNTVPPFNGERGRLTLISVGSSPDAVVGWVCHYFEVNEEIVFGNDIAVDRSSVEQMQNIPKWEWTTKN